MLNVARPLGILLMAFSVAYLSIPSGTGALILFGAVQVTMIGSGDRKSVV